MQTEPPSELETDEESAVALTAGGILRSERERLGLNEKEVADQLHITMHYVKALESNSYEKLPGAVFAKGYLKSYALLLGLDVEDLLSRYDQFAHQQKADSEEENRLLRARKNKDRNKPLVIISLIVFVAGFLGLWIANSFFGEASVSEVPSTAESMDGSDSADNLRPTLSRQSEAQATQAQLSIEVDSEEISDASGQSALVPTPVFELNTLAEPLDQETELNLVSGSSDSGESGAFEESPTLEDLTVELQALRAEQQVETESIVENAQPRVIAIDGLGSDVLRISFTGESWVEVNDSDSQQIYRDIRGAGDVLEITGRAPFNILLGDAPFTQMSLNGAEIDLSADIRIDNSARLTVGL